jgi:AcrR family transcriptional regulator
MVPGMSAGQVAVQGPARPQRGRGRPGYDLESLLTVAVAVFNERGYDGTSMEDLSRRLGIAKSSIYHHVDSKEQLLGLALDRALDGLFSAARRALDGMADGGVGLGGAGLDGGEAVGGVPAIARLECLVRESIGVLAERLPYVTLLLRARGNTETDRIVADLVSEAKRDGDIRPDIDPGVAARILFGMVNSVAEWYRPGGRAADHELASAVCAIAFDGLRVRHAEHFRSAY